MTESDAAFRWEVFPPNNASPFATDDGYVRCPDCGQRSPNTDLLERHLLRRCPGVIEAVRQQAA